MSETIRISHPSEFLAIVPYVLGYHPEASIVAAAFGRIEEKLLFMLRFDLPDDSAEARELVSQMTGMLARNGCERALLVGYGPGSRVTPVIDAATDMLATAGIDLMDALRAEDNRYWSYGCSDPGCCSPDGVPYNVSECCAASLAVVAGLVARPDRAAFVSMLDPVTGQEREEITLATRTQCDHARSLVETAIARYWYQEGLDRVDDALRAVAEGRTIPADQLAWLGVLLTALFVRDGAMTYIERYDDDTHIRLWTDLVRRVDPAFVAAPAALLAFVAFRSGNGALARIAVERSLAADPRYRLALLTREALDWGVPPSAAGGMDCANMGDAILRSVDHYPHLAAPTLPEGW
ncbi:DUF4192 domain-containing protein [Nonomuraea sp. NPDC050556]|uniref:DUF4192 domain-containing protein n=1 Tax=Nonomuraea sp. NPDC050556 TaxID=3364369 RepID=UPI0037B409AC